MPADPTLQETPRWDESLRLRDGESNEAYWLRQGEVANAEAAKILAWCATERAKAARTILEETP